MGSVMEGTGIQGSYTGTSNGHSAAGIAAAGKEQVKHLGGMAKERVIGQVDSRKGELVKGIQGLVSTLESAANNEEAAAVRPLISGAVGVLRKASDRLENGTTEELLAEAQDQLRQRPGLLIAGCVGVGFLLGRFIKV